jgi:hypothetical protein
LGILWRALNWKRSAYFMAIWNYNTANFYILCPFGNLVSIHMYGIFFPVLLNCVMKNLATLEKAATMIEIVCTHTVSKTVWASNKWQKSVFFRFKFFSEPSDSREHSISLFSTRSLFSAKKRNSVTIYWPLHLALMRPFILSSF